MKSLLGVRFALCVRACDVEIFTGLHAKEGVEWLFLAIIATTFLMNLFHGGRLAVMRAKLSKDDGELFLNRSLGHVAKADCDAFAMVTQYPIIPCDLCGSQDVLLHQQIKQIIDRGDKN